VIGMIKQNLASPIFAVPAFRDIIDVPLVVRRLHKSAKEVYLASLNESYDTMSYLLI